MQKPAHVPPEANANDDRDERPTPPAYAPPALEKMQKLAEVTGFAAISGAV